MAMMGHDNDKTVTDENHGRESAGVLIRRAREQAGLSREQLAARVNLLTSQILMLENDRYDSLPSAMFVRGYLRAIARVLTLNEAGLLAAWQQQVAPSAQTVASRAAVATAAGTMRPISLERASSVRKHWGLAAAALVVAGLWGWQQHEHEESRALSLTPNVVEGESAALGGIEDALNGNEAARLMDSVELLPIVKSATAIAEQPAAAPASSDQAIAQQQLASGNTQMVTAAGDQLSLRFSADCWVEIKDRDNRVLVASLKHANEKLQLEGRGPFRVLLGFAPGVEMAYNGTPVNIEVPQGSRSTRLIVGSS